jgi:hypothetical protein
MAQRTETPDIARGVLQAIFAVFLGLLITVVVGVGVNTFHPNPVDQTQEQIDALYSQRAHITGCSGEPKTECRSDSQLSAAESQQVAQIDQQIKDLESSNKEQRDGWAQSTSIILIVIATALMAISLAIGQSLALLGNGVLLGGLFTMLYGVGWGVASGNSLTRFLVLLVALVLSLVLGYLRFGRERAGAGTAAPALSPAVASAPGGLPTEGADTALAELLARMDRLEARLDAAARGLSGRPDDRE